MRRFPPQAAKFELQPSGLEVTVSDDGHVLIVDPIGDCIALTYDEVNKLSWHLYGLVIEVIREEREREVKRRLEVLLPAAVEAEIARRAEANEHNDPEAAA